MSLVTPLPLSFQNDVRSSPLKTADAFLPALELCASSTFLSDDASLWESPVSPLSPSPASPDAAPTCPHCNCVVDLGRTSLVAHVTGCYQMKLTPSHGYPHREPSPMSVDETSSTSSVKEGIAEFKDFVSTLNLRVRIGISESFYRLAKAAKSSSPGHSPRPSVSPQCEVADNHLLTLVHGQVPSTDASWQAFDAALDSRATPFRPIQLVETTPLPSPTGTGSSTNLSYPTPSPTSKSQRVLFSAAHKLKPSHQSQGAFDFPDALKCHATIKKRSPRPRVVLGVVN